MQIMEKSWLFKKAYIYGRIEWVEDLELENLDLNFNIVDI